MSASGFIVMSRKMLEHPLFEGDSARAGAWLWLVLRACWKPTPFDVAGKTITLERGQLCASIRQMGDAWGMSKSAVERFLTRLKTETMIETEAGHGKLVITICNYGKYQDVKEDARDTTGTPTGTAAGQQRDIKEQGNKGTKESPLPPKGGAAPPYAQIQHRWNELARKHGLPICEAMTDRRRTAIKARHAQYGLDGIHRAIDAVFVSPLCLGKKKDWRADFDFVFQDKSFTRLIEGSYSDDAPAKPAEPVSKEQRDRWALARQRYPHLELHKAVVKIIEDEERQLQHSKEG